MSSQNQFRYLSPLFFFTSFLISFLRTLLFSLHSFYQKIKLNSCTYRTTIPVFIKYGLYYGIILTEASRKYRAECKATLYCQFVFKYR